MNQMERRDQGLPYRCDEQVVEQQRASRRLLQQLNTADWSDFDTIQTMTIQLFGRCGESPQVTPPFFCDYGFNIQVGHRFMCNFNCTILDVAPVTIGDDVLFGPNVSLYTAGHPLHPAARATGYEYGIPITIGSRVWLGGNVIVSPGVTIGDNVVVGAGSVVTRDLPSNVVAAGNPCRVLRPITDEDLPHYFKERAYDDESWADLQRRMGC